MIYINASFYVTVTVKAADAVNAVKRRPRLNQTCQTSLNGKATASSACLTICRYHQLGISARIEGK
jgi:hypothetical protein